MHCAAVAAADAALRAAASAVYRRLATIASIPPRQLTAEEAISFLVALLCTGADAAPAERALATRSATDAIITPSRQPAPVSFTHTLALFVLCAMRRSLADSSGRLTFDEALSLHRAVRVVFSSSDTIAAVRRARYVTLVLHGGKGFEEVWDMTKSYEDRIKN